MSDAPPDHRTLEQVKWDHIDRVLLDVSGNKSRAAKILGIDRRTLYRLLAARATDPAIGH